MPKSKKDVVVVGGGITGLAAARLAADYGCEVTLVESSSAVGGLLRSAQLASGHKVDYGTHIISCTGHQTVDTSLIQILSPNEISLLPAIIAGQFRHGLIQDRKMWVDLNHPDVKLRLKILAEIKHTTALRNSCSHTLIPENSAEWVTQKLGEFILRDVYTPLLQKLQFSPPEQLHPQAIRLFGLQRVCAYTAEDTKRLKKSSEYDDILGFHDCLENASPLQSFYPKGGAGAWVERLLEHALNVGVKVRTSTSIKAIEVNKRRIKTLFFSDGTAINTDALVWTAPVSMLIKLVAPSSARPRPQMLTSKILHLVFSRPLLTSAHYLSIFDASFKAFRLTFYQNLKPIDFVGWPVTLEYLCPPDQSDQINVNFAEKELRKMRLVDDTSELIDSAFSEVSNGFPVLTREFMAGVREDASRVRECAKNIFLAGKAQGQDFFMGDVLVDLRSRFPQFIDENL